MEFVNRKREIKEFETLSKKGGLVVIYGRRRVGKTALVEKWISSAGGVYCQAIEGSESVQLEQMSEDLKQQLKINIKLTTWSDLFQIIDLYSPHLNLCIDEFPYLVQANSSLPSLMQKWLDHTKKKNLFLLLTGSSYQMMHSTFLNRSAPLFGRAIKEIEILPMNYGAFCQAIGLNPKLKESFILFSVVGGVPKYWKFLDKDKTILQNIDALFFDYSAFLENEPFKLLSDEKIEGLTPKSVLEAIGRGAHRPSEIAARVGTPQANLTRVFQSLKDAGIVEKEVPFSEKEKNSKKVLYKISDPALRFWFEVYSTKRSVWKVLSQAERLNTVEIYASKVFEEAIRKNHPGSSRYWDKSCEFDFLQFSSKGLVVREVKFQSLSLKQKKNILLDLEKKWQSSPIANSFKNVSFEVSGLEALEELSIEN